jgi:hypothetical protein
MDVIWNKVISWWFDYCHSSWIPTIIVFIIIPTHGWGHHWSQCTIWLIVDVIHTRSLNFSSCSKFHNHYPSTFLPNLHTKTLDLSFQCSILATLSPIINNVSIPRKRNLTKWKGEPTAIGNHKYPILGTNSTSSIYSIDWIKIKE